MTTVPPTKTPEPQPYAPAYDNRTMKQALAMLNREVKDLAEHDDAHIAHVSDLLERQHIATQAWSRFAVFREQNYTRHLVAHDEKFTVLLLCWGAGQRSPIHDHSGSSCWVKVLDGALQERRFARESAAGSMGPATTAKNGEPLVEIGKGSVYAGQVTYINDNQGFHEMANVTDEPCVTLHVYSPPYYECSALCENGASRMVSMLSATAPTREMLFNEIRVGACAEHQACAKRVGLPPKTGSVGGTSCGSCGSLDTKSHEDAWTAVSGEDATGSAAGSPVKAATRRPSAAGGVGLWDYQALLNECDPSHPTQIKQVVTQLQSLRFTVDDCKTFVHFSDFRINRMLLHTNEHFSLLVLCWLPGQKTPVHDHHGSRSWVRVMAGSLQFDECCTCGKCPDEQGTAVLSPNADSTCKRRRLHLTPDTPVFDEDESLGMHTTGNNGDSFAVTLHLYQPPYEELNYSTGCCPSTGKKNKYTLPVVPVVAPRRKSPPLEQAEV